MKIKNIINESRPSNLLGFLSMLTKIPLIDKIIKTKYISNGVSAIIRDKTGNAYEISMRPAKYSIEDWGDLLKKK